MSDQEKLCMWLGDEPLGVRQRCGKCNALPIEMRCRPGLGDDLDLAEAWRLYRAGRHIEAIADALAAERDRRAAEGAAAQTGARTAEVARREEVIRAATRAREARAEKAAARVVVIEREAAEGRARNGGAS